MNLSNQLKYYLLTIPLAILIWLIFSFFGVEFINNIFFMMAYIWHFSLLAPLVKERAMNNRQKLSILSAVFKLNFYLQMFIKYDRFKYTPSLVRAISPFLFTLILFIVGGAGNSFFALLGSFVFEVLYLIVIKKFITNTNDQEIPKVILNEETSHE